MTLSGQEARIQLRYHLPKHPQNQLYEDLCHDYKQLSEEQLQKQRDQIEKLSKKQKREKDLDKEFTKRLLKMEEEIDEEDSLSSELPRQK